MSGTKQLLVGIAVVLLLVILAREETMRGERCRDLNGESYCGYQELGVDNSRSY